MMAVMITGKMYFALPSIAFPRPRRRHHPRKRVIQYAAAYGDGKEVVPGFGATGSSAFADDDKPRGIIEPIGNTAFTVVIRVLTCGDN
jgi:hypothetical protein